VVRGEAILSKMEVPTTWNNNGSRGDSGPMWKKSVTWGDVNDECKDGGGAG
jgi:hypothetical protein